MDRRTQLIESTEFNGIDFVEIADPTQTVLRVHFLNGVTIGALSSPPRHQRRRDDSDGHRAADRANTTGASTMVGSSCRSASRRRATSRLMR